VRRPDGETRARAATLAALLLLTALLAFSEYLSLNRIFQVDELQCVATARILAQHLQNQYSAFASLMFFGPMMWLGGAINHSALLLRSERLLFFVLFWVNIALIVRVAGIKLRTRAGVLALLIAATLAPLWDYGFEIRHDNALLATVLLAWSAARPLRESKQRHLFLVGFLAAVAEFVAYKAAAYVLPIVAYAVLAAWLEDRRPLLRAIGSSAAGAAVATALAFILHTLAGTWPLFISNLVGIGKVAAGQVVRMSAAPTLIRLLFEAPIVVAFAAFAFWKAARRRTSRWSRESLLPEAFLLLCALAALVVNPTPFPYNLVLLVPQAAILALRLLPDAMRAWAEDSRWRIGLATLLGLHCAVWALTTQRHIQMSNTRQLELMNAAESLTDPDAHAVFDGAALVPTRHPPGYHWLIHTFSIAYFRDGTWTPIRAQLAEGHTPVVIPNYRVMMLPAVDRDFIVRHYVPLAGDFLVAGGVLPAGDSTWDCLVDGRYAIYPAADVLVDGVALRRGAVVRLLRGGHAVHASAPVSIVWVGPRLSAPPAMGRGRAADVFVNWY
jgi:hypothetical protein